MGYNEKMNTHKLTPLLQNYHTCGRNNLLHVSWIWTPRAIGTLGEPFFAERTLQNGVAHSCHARQHGLQKLGVRRGRDTCEHCCPLRGFRRTQLREAHVGYEAALRRSRLLEETVVLRAGGLSRSSQFTLGSAHETSCLRCSIRCANGRTGNQTRPSLLCAAFIGGWSLGARTCSRRAVLPRWCQRVLQDTLELLRSEPGKALLKSTPAHHRAAQGSGSEEKGVLWSIPADWNQSWGAERSGTRRSHSPEALGQGTPHLPHYGGSSMPSSMLFPIPEQSPWLWASSLFYSI